MDQGYRKIFWGLIFVTFHLEIGLLQILPPFIGWIILVLGLGEIRDSLRRSSISTESFKQAGLFGKILVGLTLIGTLGTLSSGEAFLEAPQLLYYPVIVLLLEIVTAYYILEGTHQVFMELGFEEKGEETKRGLRTYLILSLSSAVIIPFALFFHHDLSSVIGILLGVLAMIYLLVSINRIKKFWETDPLGTAVGFKQQKISAEEPVAEGGQKA